MLITNGITGNFAYLANSVSAGGITCFTSYFVGVMTASTGYFQYLNATGISVSGLTATTGYFNQIFSNLVVGNVRNLRRFYTPLPEAYRTINWMSSISGVPSNTWISVC